MSFNLKIVINLLKCGLWINFFSVEKKSAPQVIESIIKINIEIYKTSCIRRIQQWRLSSRLICMVYVLCRRSPRSTILPIRSLHCVSSWSPSRYGLRWKRRPCIHPMDHLYPSATLEKRRYENTASGCPRFPQFTGPSFSLSLFLLSLRHHMGRARIPFKALQIIYVSTGRPPLVCVSSGRFRISLLKFH